MSQHMNSAVIALPLISYRTDESTQPSCGRRFSSHPVFLWSWCHALKIERGSNQPATGPSGSLDAEPNGRRLTFSALDTGDPFAPGRTLMPAASSLLPPAGLSSASDFCVPLRTVNFPLTRCGYTVHVLALFPSPRVPAKCRRRPWPARFGNADVAR